MAKKYLLKDGSDLWETLKNNLFLNRPAKEIRMGRFNFREKFEYLGLIWGTIVMTVTGTCPASPAFERAASKFSSRR